MNWWIQYQRSQQTHFATKIQKLSIFSNTNTHKI